MVVTLAGMVMLVKLVQEQKAYRPMVVSLQFSPNVTLVRLSQCPKAQFPILVTLSGMTMLVRLARSLKAPPATAVTVYSPISSGITMSICVLFLMPVMVQVSPSSLIEKVRPSALMHPSL